MFWTKIASALLLSRSPVARAVRSRWTSSTLLDTERFVPRELRLLLLSRLAAIISSALGEQFAKQNQSLEGRARDFGAPLWFYRSLEFVHGLAAARKTRPFG